MNEINEARVAEVSKPRKVQKNYINNPDLQYALECYLEQYNKAVAADMSLPRIPNYIGESFQKLCNKIASRPNFYGYSFKDEMILDGVENCLVSIHNYDVTHKLKNPFGYFTRIIWHAFLRRIEKEKKQAYIKQKNFQMNYDVEAVFHDRHHMEFDNSYADDLITSFEKKNLTKPKKSATVKTKHKKGLELFMEGE